MTATGWADVAEQLDRLPDTIEVELESRLQWDAVVLYPRVERDCDCDYPGDGCPTRIEWVDSRGLRMLTAPVGTHSIATRRPTCNGWSNLTVTHDDPADETAGIDTVQYHSCGIGSVDPAHQARMVYLDLIRDVEEMLTHAARVRIREQRSWDQRQLADRVAAFAKTFRHIDADGAALVADVAVGDIRHDLEEATA